MESEKENYQEEGLHSDLTKGKIVFIFIIGFLLGVIIKAQATRTITIGFDDYKIANLRSDFSLTEKKIPAEDSQDPQGGQESEQENVDDVEVENLEQEERVQ